MKIESFEIKNFKGLRDMHLASSRFVCVIGENNAGKSSTLQSIMRHLDGKKVEASTFFDPDLPIEIQMNISNVESVDLSRVGAAHRSKIEEVLTEGRLSTIRRFRQSGATSEFWVVKKQPADINLRRAAFEEKLKGKRAPGLAKA